MMLQPPPLPPPLPAPAPPPPPLGQALARPALVILFGMILLFTAGALEQRAMEQEPWSMALFLDGAELPLDDARPAYFRHVPLSERPQLEEQYALTREMMLQQADAELVDKLFQAERIIMTPMRPEEFEPLLASGRAPVPGMREVVAGDMASDAGFLLDGQRFEVVGRLKRHVAGTFYTYLLPEDATLRLEHFAGAVGATTGSMHPEGMLHRELIEPLLRAQSKGSAQASPPPATETETPNTAPVAADAAAAPPPTVLGAFTRSSGGIVLLAFAALVLIAAAGAVFTKRLLEAWARNEDVLLQPVLNEIVYRPRLFMGVHVGLYGVFFGFMLMGMLQPLLNFQAVNLVSAIFSSGELAYIGQAYASENVLQAATATFINNYVVQTLGFTFLVSVPPFAFGVLKTALSFALVGFALAPVWQGTALGYSYHAVTMVVELEAYIIASFCVIAWPLRVIEALKHGNEAAIAIGFRALLGGALLCGIILFLAAFYEAATLILLN